MVLWIATTGSAPLRHSQDRHGGRQRKNLLLGSPRPSETKGTSMPGKSVNEGRSLQTDVSLAEQRIQRRTPPTGAATGLRCGSDNTATPLKQYPAASKQKKRQCIMNQWMMMTNCIVYDIWSRIIKSKQLKTENERSKRRIRTAEVHAYRRRSNVWLYYTKCE